MSGLSVCLRIGVWDLGFESCIRQGKTTCLLSIRISLACATASKLRTTNIYMDWQIKCVWGFVGQKQVARTGAGNYISRYLWDVITCACPWYLLLAHKSSYIHNRFDCITLKQVAKDIVMLIHFPDNPSCAVPDCPHAASWQIYDVTDSTHENVTLGTLLLTWFNFNPSVGK